jgi:hypothetical protein
MGVRMGSHHVGRRTGIKSGGRKKGTPNKRTVMLAEQARDAIEEMRAQKKEPARSVLQRMMELAEGAASYFQPRTPAQLLAGQKENPNKDTGEFREWVRIVIDCAKTLIMYQEPKLAAVMLAGPAPEIAPQAQVVKVELKVFEAPPPTVTVIEGEAA